MLDTYATGNHFSAFAEHPGERKNTQLRDLMNKSTDILLQLNTTGPCYYSLRLAI
jgi:hypothetical protein